MPLGLNGRDGTRPAEPGFTLHGANRREVEARRVIINTDDPRTAANGRMSVLRSRETLLSMMRDLDRIMALSSKTGQ